jgi:hypothetical protein
VLTVNQAMTSRINRISGTCAGSDDWYQMLNDATRQLMRRGNWWGTVKRFTGCIYNGCITWPHYVGTVLAINRCGRSAPPKNQWYDFDAVLPEHVRHWNHNQSFLCAHDLALVDHDTSPVFNQIPCNTNRFLQFYITQPTDAGKTITIFGVDGNGLEVLTTRSDGTIQPGIILSLAIPFVQTPILFRRIDRVIKDITDGPVYGYQFDGTNTFPLATYSSGETLPDYRSNKLLTSSCTTTNCQQWPSKISAFVKLEFVEARRPDDLILIDNLDALAVAMQSVKLGDAYDSAGAETMMVRAVHELNIDLRNKLPIDQVPVRVKVFGTADLHKRGIGQLM